MAPRKRKELEIPDRGNFSSVLAKMEAVGLGKPTASTPALAQPPALEAGSYKGMTRVEKLFKAIDLGDAATIRDTIKAKYVRNKDGTESNAVIEPALSLVPTDKIEAQHFPEPLLHRAVRSQQMASVMELFNLGNALPAEQKEKFFGTREIDGATVLHDLAASIPAGKEQRFATADLSKWSPDALIPLFISAGVDVMAQSDGKTAADIAPNVSVKTFLEAEMSKALAEDQQHAVNWQAKLAKQEREKAADGRHLSSVR